jgi:hypothetical protein
MKILNIITPVSRIYNLPIIYHSIFDNITDKISIKWYIIVDSSVVNEKDILIYESYFKNNIHNNISIEYTTLNDSSSRYGNSQRNYALSKINSDWVYFLDDDTTIHKNFFNTISESMDSSLYDIVLFSQKRNASEFPFVDILTPNLSNIIQYGIGTVDTGQIVYNYSVLKGDGYYPTDLYQADGALIQRICSKVNPNRVAILTDVLCMYNSLR